MKIPDIDKILYIKINICKRNISAKFYFNIIYYEEI